MASELLYYFTLAIACLVALPLVVLTIECFAAKKRRPAGSAAPGVPPTEQPGRPRVAVLVPAHNEADGLATTLNSINRQLEPGDQLWVIADNCSDGTATVARSMGAIVLERTNLVQRGKGFALNYAFDTLAADPPGYVVLIDADCTLEDDALALMVNHAIRSARPVQSAYYMHAPAGAGPNSMISECAVTVKNVARPLGMARFGLPCLLTGSGIVLAWPQVERIRFTGGSIVEDMQLAIDLIRSGDAPVLCGDAVVMAPLPVQSAAASGQRKRWEHGHLSVVVEQAPRLMALAVRERRLGLLAVAVDLAIPPLSLLAAISGAAVVVLSAYGLLTGFWSPALIVLISILAAGVAVAQAVHRFARRPGSLKALAAAPLYMLSKVPLYFSFLFDRQTDWNRTARDLPSGAHTASVDVRGPHRVTAADASLAASDASLANSPAPLATSQAPLANSHAPRATSSTSLPTSQSAIETVHAAGRESVPVAGL